MTYGYANNAASQSRPVASRVLPARLSDVAQRIFRRPDSHLPVRHYGKGRRGKEVVKQLQIPEDKFKVSSSWVENFQAQIRHPSGPIPQEREKCTVRSSAQCGHGRLNAALWGGAVVTYSAASALEHWTTSLVHSLVYPTYIPFLSSRFLCPQLSCLPAPPEVPCCARSHIRCDTLLYHRLSIFYSCCRRSRTISSRVARTQLKTR